MSALWWLLVPPVWLAAAYAAGRLYYRAFDAAYPHQNGVMDDNDRILIAWCMVLAPASLPVGALILGAQFIGQRLLNATLSRPTPRLRALAAERRAAELAREVSRLEREYDLPRVEDEPFGSLEPRKIPRRGGHDD